MGCKATVLTAHGHAGRVGWVHAIAGKLATCSKQYCSKRVWNNPEMQTQFAMRTWARWPCTGMEGNIVFAPYLYHALYNISYRRLENVVYSFSSMVYMGRALTVGTNRGRKKWCSAGAPLISVYPLYTTGLKGFPQKRKIRCTVYTYTCVKSCSVCAPKAVSLMVAAECTRSTSCGLLLLLDTRPIWLACMQDKGKYRIMKCGVSCHGGALAVLLGYVTAGE